MLTPLFDEPFLGIYRFITFISICLTHFFSIVFVLLWTPKTPALHGYRLSKYIMAVAYTLVAVFNAVELLMEDVYVDGQFVLLNTVVLSSLQIFLLSAALTMLINTRYFMIRKFLVELLPTILLGIISYTLLLKGCSSVFQYVLGVFIAYFAFQCVRYSMSFFKERANTIRKIDNFFSSETNTRKLQWITQTFIALMCMGVFAMLSCIMPKVFLIPFSVMYFIFYFFLGMKHLNYMYYFHEYEFVFNTQTESNDSTTLSNNHSIPWEQLESAILKWEKTHSFTEPGLTIEQVAIQLNTNRTYLSNYVNQIKQQSFKEWINQLRIGEAKRLLLEKKTLHVGEIGLMVGLPDKSNFGRLFTRNTGVSPQTWRKQQLHK